MNALRSLLTPSPAWSRVFGQGICDGVVFSEFCGDFFDDPLSQNFLLLIEHTVSRVERLRTSLEKKRSPSKDLREQTCNALHLCTILFNYLFAKFPEPHVRILCGWHIKNSSIDTNILNSENGMVSLIHSSIGCLDALFYDWELRDVTYFAVNLLLSLFSGQLYQRGKNEISLKGEEMFLQYIFDIADKNWKDCCTNPRNDFHETMPVKLVKGLMMNVVDCHVPSFQSRIRSSVQTHVTKTARYGYEQVEALNHEKTGKGNVSSVLKEVIAQIVELPFQAFKSLFQEGLYEGFVDKDTVEGNQSDQFSLIRHHASTYPLSERCSNLLLLFLHNQGYTDQKGYNPFIEAFCALHDESLEGYAKGGDIEMISLSNDNILGRKVFFEFDLLHKALLKLLPSESSTLLLYTILLKHPTYLETIVSSDFNRSGNPSIRVRDLLSSILRGLYDVEGAQSIDHLYMLTVNLLILIQHPLIGPYTSSIKISAPWYKEHTLVDVKICDLIILCVIRTIMHSLFRLRDSYLVHNCFAVILNLAPLVNEIHNYTAERLVTVTSKLCKRIIKMKVGKGVMMSPSDQSLSSIVNGKCDETCLPLSSNVPLRALEDSLRVFVKAINISLCPSNRASNVYIAYSLILESDTLLKVLRIPDIIQIVDNEKLDTDEKVMGTISNAQRLEQLIVHFVDMLSVACSGHDSFAADITVKNLRTILEQNHGASRSSIDECSLGEIPLSSYLSTFAYEEGDEPSSFFIPYVWASCIRSTSEIGWYARSFAIVDPSTSGLFVPKS